MSIYKRGRVYWYNFMFEGRHIQASTKVRSAEEARNIERAAWTALARGLVGLPERGKPKPCPTIIELLDALQKDFELRGIWTDKNKSNFKTARAAFPEKMKAAALTTADIDRYIEKKQREGRAAPTINRALGLVSQSFKKAVERGDLDRAPKFRHLSEKGNERKGFLEPPEFSRLRVTLPDDLKDFCHFAYITGWRKSEIASLTWSDVEGDVVRLRGENSKNDEARCVVLTGELAKIIERRRKIRVVEGTLTGFVFHRDGRKVLEFRKAWAAACVAAKLGKMVCPKCKGESAERTCAQCEIATEYQGRIFHDFRRSAVRNMIRGGVAQSIAMKISGHKTASMFRRYDIANEDDLRSAMQAVEHYHKTATKQKTVLSMSKK